MDLMLVAIALLAYQNPPKVPSTLVAQKRSLGVWKASVNVPKLPVTPSGRALVATASNEGAKAMTVWVGQTLQSLKTFKPAAPLEYEVMPIYAYERGRIASAVQLTFDWSGGAHPNTTYSIYNFWDAKPMKLADFFGPGYDGARQVSYLLLERLVKNPQAMWLQDGTVHDLTPQQLEHFQVGPKGLTWTFGPYELGPYVSGTITQFLSAKDLGSQFRASMLQGK
ncbi:hypothetical protein BH11ARM2_BH11ARM2_13190 [soil metagenome]